MDLQKFKKILVNLLKWEDIFIIFLITSACILSYLFIRKILLNALIKISQKTKTNWDNFILESGVLNNLAYIVPALILYYGSHFFPTITEHANRILSVFILFNITFAINKLLGQSQRFFSRLPVFQKHPIKGYIQILQIFLIIICIILSISILLDRSPWLLLSGLGAVTAVLILVFKDTILSLLASIQIAMYDLVRVGDWIEMPKYGADGDVIDIALHTVKVQNWDKTLITIPTFKLIDESFKNWRGMKDAGGRRIKRYLLIDQKSVKFCDEEMLERYKKIQILRPYIEEKQKEIEEYNRTHNIDTTVLINGRRMTNLGTFRAYVKAYLQNHPMIRQDMTFLVRHLQPTPEGIPLEIYVFSKTTIWANYEAIQADIFDHLISAIPLFDLRLFQRPSGYDLEKTSVPPIF